MAKAPKLLTILVDPAISAWPEVLKLQEQGHTIVRSPFVEYDLILGPKVHRMSEHERKWFPEAIAEARRLKYPKETK